MYYVISNMCISCQENSSGLIIHSAIPRTVESFNRAWKHTGNLQALCDKYVSLLDHLVGNLSKI